MIGKQAADHLVDQPRDEAGIGVRVTLQEGGEEAVGPLDAQRAMADQGLVGFGAPMQGPRAGPAQLEGLVQSEKNQLT